MFSQQNPQAEEPGEGPQHMDHKETVEMVWFTREAERHSRPWLLSQTLLEYIFIRREKLYWN